MQHLFENCLGTPTLCNTNTHIYKNSLSDGNGLVSTFLPRCPGRIHSGIDDLGPDNRDMHNLRTLNGGNNSIESNEYGQEEWPIENNDFKESE